MFAVVSRIKITLVDTVIRMEYCPSDSATGIALELRIGRFVVMLCISLGSGPKYLMHVLLCRSVSLSGYIEQKPCTGL